MKGVEVRTLECVMKCSGRMCGKRNRIGETIINVHDFAFSDDLGMS